MEESPDGTHGSVFTITIPLGKDHLPPEFIDDSSQNTTVVRRKYAMGVIEEAQHWVTTQPLAPGEGTPSDTAATETSESSAAGSSEGSRLDPTTLFFSKNDVILIGRSPLLTS